MPRISIITSTYNRPAYLRRAVDSIARQTFRDFEHIIVEDYESSPPVDPTVYPDSIVRRVPIFMGSYGIFARNMGAEIASGELLAWLDDDNWWEPDHLELLVGLLDEKSVDFVWGSTRLWRDNKEVEVRNCSQPRRGGIDTSEIVVKRELFMRHGGWHRADGHGVDGLAAQRWVEGGARYAHLPIVTHNQWLGERFDPRD